MVHKRHKRNSKRTAWLAFGTVSGLFALLMMLLYLFSGGSAFGYTFDTRKAAARHADEGTEPVLGYDDGSLRVYYTVVDQEIVPYAYSHKRYAWKQESSPTLNPQRITVLGGTLYYYGEDLLSGSDIVLLSPKDRIIVPTTCTIGRATYRVFTVTDHTAEPGLYRFALRENVTLYPAETDTLLSGTVTLTYAPPGRSAQQKSFSAADLAQEDPTLPYLLRQTANQADPARAVDADTKLPTVKQLTTDCILGAYLRVETGKKPYIFLHRVLHRFCFDEVQSYLKISITDYRTRSLYDDPDAAGTTLVYAIDPAPELLAALEPFYQ